MDGMEYAIAAKCIKHPANFGTTSFLSFCLHLVKFFCNFISNVTTDGVIPSCNGANISMTDRTFSVGTQQMFSRCGQLNVGAGPH